MRILIAGVTGVIGRQLVPVLHGGGHEVVGLARSRARAAAVETAGAEVVTADALDADAVAAAVDAARPDAIVNLLTAIPAEIDPRRMARDFAQTNRLRAEGTRNLAAAAAGARLVSESIAFAYSPDADPVAAEDAPLWDPTPAFRPVIAALRTLEQTTLASGGTVLRYGQLYGPGTALAPDGATVRQIRARRLPIVGRGGAIWSFLHTVDAATATLAALEQGASGVFNVVDDEPAPVARWVPHVANLIGAPPPRRVPVPLALLVAGRLGVAFMTRLRGASNARARTELCWRPRYASWREGFAEELQRSAEG